jgi:hypothetical protein
MQMPRKPTGITGAFRVDVHPDGTITGGFEQTAFSTEKEAVELAIVEAFIRSMNRELSKAGETFCISNPRLNPTDDYDFVVSSTRGKGFLELREIQTGIKYERAPASYLSSDFGRVLFDAVHEKSKHYGVHPGRPFFLLLYSTHWAFSPTDTALMCARYWLMRDRPLFDAVFTYEPLDATEGDARWLFPYPPDLLGDFEPDAHRNDRCMNFDLRSGAVVSVGSGPDQAGGKGQR